MRRRGLTVVLAVLAACMWPAGAGADGAARRCPPQRIALPTPEGYTFSEVLAFGPHGLVGGGVGRLVGPDPGVAVLWRDGQVVQLLGPGFVADINRRGDVLVNRPNSADVVRRGAVEALAPLPGGQGLYARRMNDRGDIAGSSTSSGVETPVVWRRGGPPVALPLPEGMVGGAGLGINRRGDVSGFVHAGSAPLPYVWLRGKPDRFLDASGYVDEQGAPDPGFGNAFVIDSRRRVGGVVGPAFAPGAVGAIWAGRTGAVRETFGSLPGNTTILGTSGRGDFAGGTESGTSRRAFVADVNGTFRSLLALSGDPADASWAHPVERMRGGDVMVGGYSIRPGFAEPQATIWTCAYAQGVPIAGPAEGTELSARSGASGRGAAFVTNVGRASNHG